MTYTLVGVTGHIDHGKTTLVRTLTGKETDTHPEEKRRGITIDLGFAEFEVAGHRFALIDAPGHQRYIGNLLAGVSRINVALLLVAADQGIEAQTIEHAAIVRSLGVQRLIVVISRCDLVDAAQCDALHEELELFLDDVGYKEFDCIRLSCMTGAGVEELKTCLVSAACELAAQPKSLKPEALPFRMPVDRASRIEGRGWIAAGTTYTGQVRVNDTIKLLRTSEQVRVRDIEQHGESASIAEPGRRTALNLVGAFEDLRRGDELVSPHGLAFTQRLAARIELFGGAEPMRLPSEAQLHIGTTACDVSISGENPLSAGQPQFVRLKTSEPVVAQTGQRLLLRRPYPVGSFAGGEVIVDEDLFLTHQWPIQPRQWRQRRKEMAPPLRCVHLAATLHDALSNPREIVAQCISYIGETELHPEWLFSSLAYPSDLGQQVIANLISDGVLIQLGERLTTRAFLAWIESQAVARLMLQSDASRVGDAQTPWQHEATIIEYLQRYCTAAVASAAIAAAIQSKQIVKLRTQLALDSSETRLSKKQLATLTKLESLLDSPAPPSVKELIAKCDTSAERLTALLSIMEHQGLVISVGGGYYFAAHKLEAAKKRICECLADGQAKTAAELRDVLELTRKHVIPLLEYFDRIKLTIRDENLRHIAPVRCSTEHPTVEGHRP